VTKLQFTVEEGRWWFATRAGAPKAITAGMRKRLREVQDRMQSLKPACNAYFLKWAGEETAFDLWWDGMFGADLELAKKSIALLKRP